MVGDGAQGEGHGRAGRDGRPVQEPQGERFAVRTREKLRERGGGAFGQGSGLRQDGHERSGDEVGFALGGDHQRLINDLAVDPRTGRGGGAQPRLPALELRGRIARLQQDRGLTLRPLLPGGIGFEVVWVISEQIAVALWPLVVWA